MDTVSHLQFGYFDLVNPVDQVKHGSQGSDSKNNMIHVYSRHAQDQYCGFSFESLAPVLMISDYYHLIIGQMIRFYSRWQYDWFSQGRAVFQGVWVVTYTILLCLWIIQCCLFSPVISLDRVMMTFISFRACTTRNWTRKFTEKIDLANLSQGNGLEICQMM